MNNNYKEQINILSSQYQEYKGYEFYKYIFPNNEKKGELNTDFSKPNAIYLYHDKKDEGTKRRLRRRIMLNDTWEEDYKKYVKGNINTLCGGLAYRGRSNKLNNAQQMNALIFDLDGVGEREIKNLLWLFGKPPTRLRTLPIPTFLVSSGSGVHLYYVFEKPISLYPNIKLQLKALKYGLTFRMWNYTVTSKNEEIQYQSINQGFRMVGSINNKYGLVIRAFKIGGKVTLDYLNQYVRRKENQVDITKPFKPSKMTREQAKERYPEWYQRVVIEKNKNLKKWDMSNQGYALYEWWKRQIGSITGGHRYFFLMCMAIYACKCDVPKKKLKKDMYDMLEDLKNIPHENEMTDYDVESALEAYSKEYYNFAIDDIEKLTNVRINRNKRNYRKQRQHLERARAVQKIDYPNGEWKNKNGRPLGSGTKEKIVKDYIKEHPEENPTQIARAINVSRPTVYKYKNK